MEGIEQTRRLVEELLRSQRFAVLATESETGPYCSLIAFWAADDLSHAVFATLRSTRKFNYLITHPRVALLFDDRSNQDIDITQGMAVTATGTAREITSDEARVAASDGLVAKHPSLASFVASPKCAFVRVDIDAFHVVTHFQELVELRLHGTTGAG
ncbi:MAG: pyridoxamine 5'-phosphate oxidase family protein [Actinomycetia bacterium]|nr:pyridoxamine 5'-phosphate oxidase family protein [Actinomycetes bacterium]